MQHRATEQLAPEEALDVAVENASQRALAAGCPLLADSVDPALAGACGAEASTGEHEIRLSGDGLGEAVERVRLRIVVVHEPDVLAVDQADRRVASGSRPPILLKGENADLPAPHRPLSKPALGGVGRCIVHKDDLRATVELGEAGEGTADRRTGVIEAGHDGDGIRADVSEMRYGT
nr:hypothetical protein [Leifsonia xyli]